MVKQCTRCVMDSISDPDFTVDEKGVCNYCHFADSQVNTRRLALLERPWIIEKIRQAGKGQKYDCLIGLSGGVDSSYALHLLKNENLRPLAFSVDNGWQTPEADENIMRMVEGLKVPFYRYTIDLEAFKRLQRAFIQSGTANIEIPTDHILLATTYEMARKYGIKNIVSGGNWQTEGTMPKAFGYQAADLTHIKAIAKEFGASVDNLPHISLLQYLWYRNVERIKVTNLLDYYEYNRDRAIKTLESKYGYKPYGEKHGESAFTKWFQDVYLLRVHGIDKRKPHASSMIHSGQMTRDEALKWVNAEENVHIYSPLGITDLPQPHDYSEYPTNEKWVKRWQKFFNVLKCYGYSR